MGDDGGLVLIKNRKDGGAVYGLKPDKQHDNDYRAFRKRVEKRRAKKKNKR